MSQANVNIAEVTPTSTKTKKATTMKLNQARFTVKNYTLDTLLAAKTALTGEQAPLKQKTVDLIAADLQEGRELKQPIEVTLYDGTLYLTGGRHRVAGILQSITETQPELNPAELEVKVLEYKVDTAEQLLDRILSSNESRNMPKSGEQKLLKAACKHGFVTVTVPYLLAKIVTLTGTADYNTKEVKQLLILALAMHLMAELPDTYVSDVTANKIATSIISQLGTGKKGEREHQITTNKDGIDLVRKSVERYNIIEELLDTASNDSLFEFIDNIIYTLNNITVLPVALPAAIYSDAVMTEALRECVLCDAKLNIEDATYNTTVNPPSAMQYNAAGYVKLVIPALVSRITNQ